MAFKTNRIDKHKLENAEFDFNRGTEGQVQARKNAKGEIELVAFFGGKWYYCPMAEFNKTLNLRHGAQIDGADIMTASQTDSSGFNLLRLNAISSQASPKLNETVIFVDEVPATSAGSVSVQFANNSTLILYQSGTTTNLKIGLNVTVIGATFPSESFITALTQSDGSDWVDQVDDAVDLHTIHINRPTTAAQTVNTTMTFGTRNGSYPNIFLNILYKDGATDGSNVGFYYHKFQLNTTVSIMGSHYNHNLKAGQSGGGGGTGGSSSGGSGSGGSGGPR